jgi:sarcosine oxidase subunit delta
MLLVPCPFCGPRPEIEFRYAGAAHIERSQRPADLSDEDWAGYLYLRDNPRGLHFERWRHIHGCGRFFNAARDTVSDRFIAAYKSGQKRPDLGGEQA